MDSAYYRKDVDTVREVGGRTWSISVTDRKNKQAALWHLSDTAIWTALSEKDEAADCWYRPAGCPRPVRFVAVRK